MHTEHLGQFENGEWILWTHFCECYCEDGDDCECFVYGEVTGNEAERILKQGIVPEHKLRLRGN